MNWDDMVHLWDYTFKKMEVHPPPCPVTHAHRKYRLGIAAGAQAGHVFCFGCENDKLVLVPDGHHLFAGKKFLREAHLVDRTTSQSQEEQGKTAGGHV